MLCCGWHWAWDAHQPTSRRSFNWFLLYFYIIVLVYMLLHIFKVSSGTVHFYRSSYGTDFENSKAASPIRPPMHEGVDPLWVDLGTVIYTRGVFESILGASIP